jgi:hypothetical protein
VGARTYGGIGSCMGEPLKRGVECYRTLGVKDERDLAHDSISMYTSRLSGKPVKITGRVIFDFKDGKVEFPYKNRFIG